MQKLTQDDFNPVYRKTNDYPKLVYWTLNAPVTYNGIMISANVLQRRMSEEEDWEYIPSVKLTASVVSMGGDSEQLVRVDAEDCEITLGEEWTFDSAIDSIYAKVDELQGKYDSIDTVDYGEDQGWHGWQDFGNQHIDFD